MSATVIVSEIDSDSNSDSNSDLDPDPDPKTLKTKLDRLDSRSKLKLCASDHQKLAWHSFDIR